MTEFESIYKAYFSEVELYLRSLCRDAHLAEELTAQVFFQAMKALPKFRGECDISTWLCTMAKNCYYSYLRRHKSTGSIDELPLVTAEQSPEDRLVDQDDALRIHKILHGLPEPYKEVFSLRVFGQLSFHQIGQLFEKTDNWACVTYHRARQKIKDELEELQ